MERWYDVEFQFKNKNLEQERLNGLFETETLVQALDGLKITTRFNYKIEDKTVVIF
jgi:hypothetical protein